MVGGLGLTSRVVYVASCLLVGLALSEAGPSGRVGWFMAEAGLFLMGLAVTV